MGTILNTMMIQAERQELKRLNKDSLEINIFRTMMRLVKRPVILRKKKEYWEGNTISTMTARGRKRDTVRGKRDCLGISIRSIMTRIALRQDILKIRKEY